MMMKRAVLLGVVATLAGSGCVTTKTYDRKVAEFEAFKVQEAERVRVARARILELEQDTAKLTHRLQETEGSTVEVAALKQRLQALGQEVNKLSGERAEMNAALKLTGARLEELRMHAAATELRAQTYRSLVQRLQTMIDSGQLKVVLRQGRMLIDLPSDVLFDSGRTEIRKGARATLVAVASAVRDIRDRKFLVVGHTDNFPIHTARFPSNWELSAARAIAVARMLMAQGISPHNVGIAGQAEYESVVPNDTPEHRRQNRRIEIVLEPNLAALPALSSAAPEAPVSVH